MGKLLGLTWSAVTHVVSVDAETMAATVEEVNSSFYFHDKVTEQNFAILLRHLAIILLFLFFGGGGGFKSGNLGQGQVCLYYYVFWW